MAHEASEKTEHAEHAGHGEGHGDHGGLGKKVGLTMAVLGVLLALCSALVGGSRTELIASMVEQTGASLKYQTVSTKYRMVEANLVQLHSLLPDPKVFKDSADEIKRLEAMEPKTAEARNKITDLRVSQVLTTVTPTHSDMMAFVTLLRKLDAQAEAALEWSESYEGAIAAHGLAAEHYEWGQLCAEVGIVICSVGLLLSNKPAWTVSIVLGAATLIIVAFTAVQVSQQLSAAEAKISTAEKHYTSMGADDKAADEELFKDIEGPSSEQPPGHAEGGAAGETAAPAGAAEGAAATPAAGHSESPAPTHE